MSNYSKNLKSVDQVAEARDWSPKRVRTLIGEGLPVVKIGRQSLIHEDTLDRFLQEREAPKAAEGFVRSAAQIHVRTKEACRPSTRETGKPRSKTYV